jgi:hypothetical protein
MSFPRKRESRRVEKEGVKTSPFRKEPALSLPKGRLREILNWGKGRRRVDFTMALC